MNHPSNNNNMIVTISLMVSLFCALSSPAVLARQIHYPQTRRDTIVENYFGVKVPAPYQWMENQESQDVKRWVEAENKVTFSYLDKIPFRKWMRKRLTKLWNYEKVGIPGRKSGVLFYSKNDGLQNQSPIYMQRSLKSRPKVILDPNTLSPDGSIALMSSEPSPDARFLAYGLSQGGSDWEDLHIMDISTGNDLPDTVRWVKFSGISWTKDSRGFFYSRFPEPPQGRKLTAEGVGQQLYYHRLGTSQSKDRLFFDLRKSPGWYVGGGVTEDGQYLFIYVNRGTESRNKLYYVNLKNPENPDFTSPVVPLFDTDDAEYAVIGNVGTTLYVLTTLDAPNRRVVAFDIRNPSTGNWKTVVPEGKNVIESAILADSQLVVVHLVDAHSEVEIYPLGEGRRLKLKLPGIGTISGISGRCDTPELFYAFTSFLYPTTVFRYNFRTGSTTVFQKPRTDFNPDKYQTKQVFYKSKDGTRIPMFITFGKKLKLNGKNPTVLYGYGGFNISITPSFNPILPLWLEMGGIYAVANLRGGGEYGEAWHHAGMLDKKQNVFDDFISAAEYLIHEKYTSPAHLAVHGYSNGGLLVGAVITQRPDLFGAAYAGAGVMDMLRYQKFSAGVGWVPEYGSSDDSTAFHYLLKYSPVQNVKPGVCYPATIVTTADHDDRVVPSHSYKFIAALQHDQSCNKPVLIRVETKTSHGYMPTNKRIAQLTDVWAFTAFNLGIRNIPTKKN
ncbi:MAG: prolyl oligopeptidase family serine peptidase [Candidatus Kryptoniota bacterium]